MLTMQVMACMGIIIGLFLLLGINLTDFTGNIFKRLLDGPKGIREEILEQMKLKRFLDNIISRLILKKLAMMLKFQLVLSVNLELIYHYLTLPTRQKLFNGKMTSLIQ